MPEDGTRDQERTRDFVPQVLEQTLDEAGNVTRWTCRVCGKWRSVEAKYVQSAHTQMLTSSCSGERVLDEGQSVTSHGKTSKRCKELNDEWEANKPGGHALTHSCEINPCLSDPLK